MRRLRLEGISLRGIHRVTGISLSWLVEMNKRWAAEVSEEFENPKPEKKDRRPDPSMRRNVELCGLES